MRSTLLFLLFITLKTIGQTSDSVLPFIIVKPIMCLNVASDKGDMVEFEFKGDNDLINGIEDKKAINVAIKSNQNWRLSISSYYTYMTYLNGDLSLLPVSILSFEPQDNGEPVVLSLVEQEIANGPRGGIKEKDNNFSIDVTATPGVFTVAGTFIANVIFTLSPD